MEQEQRQLGIGTRGDMVIELIPDRYCAGRHQLMGRVPRTASHAAFPGFGCHREA